MFYFPSLTYLKTHFFLLSILYTGSNCADGQHLDLSGKWKLQNHNGSIVVSEALIPGYVHTALLKAKVIDDPYFRNNDKLYRWIDYDDWMYSRTFYGVYYMMVCII